MIVFLFLAYFAYEVYSIFSTLSAFQTRVHLFAFRLSFQNCESLAQKKLIWTQLFYSTVGEP